MKATNFESFSLLVLLAGSAESACFNTLTPSVPAPSIAPGYAVQLVATGLNRPRGITFDGAGHLLVVESGTGITALTIKDGGGSCVGVQSKKTVISDGSLNHGLTLGLAGKGIYASSSDSVYWYPYDRQTASINGDRKTFVSGMSGTDHTTRTLLVSHKAPGNLVVTRGSSSNIDPDASNINSGHSQIKSFPYAQCSVKTCDFLTSGKLLAWGIRNEVGIAEEPTTGGIYGVENSVDQMTRNGVDIHEENPGEKLNFFGYLNGTVHPNQGTNFGYPQCYAAWKVSDIPNNSLIKTGTQFAIDGSGVTDQVCRNQRTAPSLVFQAHMAPLDIKFNNAGTTAWVTFHGSWDRDTPAGYKLGRVEFANGRPVQSLTNSMRALTDIVSNQNTPSCPSGNCFRPVGLAWDGKGRLYFSSDATGEIYVVTKSDGSGLA